MGAIEHGEKPSREERGEKASASVPKVDMNVDECLNTLQDMAGTEELREWMCAHFEGALTNFHTRISHW